MIRRIELVNFMSHTHTVIEPAAGLTVLFGPNNCGKSAVVAALQILCHNELSTYVTRHNERESSVTIETDDGHVIQWRRKHSPAYTIDGVPYDRLGRGTPPAELHEVLRLPKVLADGNQAFDVHFGEQKAPIFLLDKPASHAAQFFASSSDAARLVEMQRRHQQKSAEAKRERSRLEARRETLTADLKHLEPIDPLHLAIDAIEQRYVELQKIAARADQLARDLAELRNSSSTLQKYEARSVALAALSAAPIQTNPEPLKDHIQQLDKTRKNLAKVAETAQALAPLTLVPDVAEEQTLKTLVQQISKHSHAFAGAAASCDAVLSLAAPPIEKRTEQIQQLLDDLRLHQVRASDFESRLSTLAALQPAPTVIDATALALAMTSITGAFTDLKKLGSDAITADKAHRAAGDALRAFAIEAQVCPTCGEALDPDRLIGHAAAHGLGDAVA